MKTQIEEGMTIQPYAHIFHETEGVYSIIKFLSIPPEAVLPTIHHPLV